MRQLNAQDDRWLALDTPENPYQIGALLLFETDSERRSKDFANAVRSHLAQRLPATPLLVRHCPAPFHFDSGLWCDLDRCDLDTCVFRVDADRPQTRDDLNAFVAGQVMQQWEPGAPMFRVFVFDRLDASLGAGRVALMLQTHHALADGLGFQSIVAALTDAERDAEEAPQAQPREREEPPLAPNWLLSSGVRFAREAFADRLRAGDQASARKELEAFRARPGSQRARTPIIEGLPTTNSQERLYEFLSLPLESFVSVAKALGGTVNDAFLTVTGGAMRAYLADRGLLEALGDRPLVGLGARSFRGPEHGEFGNHIGLLLPHLGTHIADPVKRFESIRLSMRAEVERSDLSERLASRDDRPFGARRRRAAPESGTAAGNVSVSNVPGPKAARFLAGYRLLANHPAPNLPAGHLVNVTLRRYGEMLDFGLVSCPTIVPDLDRLRDHFVDAYEELKAGDMKLIRVRGIGLI